MNLTQNYPDPNSFDNKDTDSFNSKDSYSSSYTDKEFKNSTYDRTFTNSQIYPHQNTHEFSSFPQ